MKKNVFLILVTLFIFNFSLQAQTQTTAMADSTKVTGFKFYTIENYNFPFKITNTQAPVFNFNMNMNYFKKSLFQSYNNVSMISDFYEQNSDGTYTYANPGRNLENLYRGVKIDSYNPKGMSANSKSIIFGVFGTILDKIQK
ncbi:MAG: hypothetical protein AB8B65_20215 [Kordia sp.]|uniref:hypothetical protein n=1 Tax=Kordia sp. TaxID=1965332 RepID=UPI00385EAB7B